MPEILKVGEYTIIYGADTQLFYVRNKDDNLVGKGVKTQKEAEAIINKAQAKFKNLPINVISRSSNPVLARLTSVNIVDKKFHVVNDEVDRWGSKQSDCYLTSDPDRANYFIATEKNLDIYNEIRKLNQEIDRLTAVRDNKVKEFECPITESFFIKEEDVKDVG